jgi:hypothetical protein
MLVDPLEGNLRLTERATVAIDKGSRLPDAMEDIDRNPRGVQADIGAHEFRK